AVKSQLWITFCVYFPRNLHDFQPMMARERRRKREDIHRAMISLLIIFTKNPPLLSGVMSIRNTESGIHQYAKRSHARKTSSRIL
ncbi:MAG: hypothetical protein MN733_04285, partial [Nitrososphaera sp.]|nr:hypothetical protein [Nitrososphaera sp.]